MEKNERVVNGRKYDTYEEAKMSRGPTITQAEINRAHALKAEGKKVDVIAVEMKRSPPTVRKMLRLPVIMEQPS